MMKRITGIWYLYEFSFRLVGATLEPREGQ